MSTNLGFIGDRILRSLVSKYPNECAKGSQIGDYTVIGASVLGRLHAHEGTNRDDAWAAGSNGKWLVASVSDGAGSQAQSRYGASYTANRLCHRLLRAISAQAKLQNLTDEPPSRMKEPPTLKEIVQKAFQDTHADLDARSKRINIGLDELHCTLLGLLLNTETGELATGQVGDGLILGLAENGEAIPLVEPPGTDDPGASYFITQSNWECYFEARSIDAVEARGFTTFYLMTDGVANDCQYGPPQDILRRWANDIDREIRLIPSVEITAERLRRYLANYRVQGSFDDRTLVVIYRSKTAG